MFIVTNIQPNPSKLKFTWREVATNDFILNALQGDRRGERCEWPMIMAYRNFVNFVQQYGAAPLRASPFFGLMTDEEHKALLAQLLPVVIMGNHVRAFVVDANSSSAIASISKKLSIEQHTDYDIENISVDTLEIVLQEWKEKDSQDAQSFHQREHKNEVLLNKLL